MNSNKNKNMYNVFYNGRKINKAFLNDDDIATLKKNIYVYKKDQRTNTLEKIKVKNLRIIKTIII